MLAEIDLQRHTCAKRPRRSGGCFDKPGAGQHEPEAGHVSQCQKPRSDSLLSLPQQSRLRKDVTTILSRTGRPPSVQTHPEMPVQKQPRIAAVPIESYFLEQALTGTES